MLSSYRVYGMRRNWLMMVVVLLAFSMILLLLNSSKTTEDWPPVYQSMNQTVCEHVPCPPCASPVAPKSSSFVLDVIIPHFMPLNVSRHRTVRQLALPEGEGSLVLHVFVIDQLNDTVCYSHPITGKVKCMARLHVPKDAEADMKPLLLQGSRVCYDMLACLRLFEPTTDYTMILEDDCSICPQFLTNGRLSSVLSFMRDNDARLILTGTGGCGEVFKSSDVITEVPNYLEKQLPRQTAMGFDYHFKKWGESTGKYYTYKYNAVHHHSGGTIAFADFAWAASYTNVLDYLVSQCGEIQLTFPHYDVENCWNVNFSPCNNFNMSRYAEDSGRNPYLVDTTSLSYAYGTTAKRKWHTTLGKETPYTTVDLAGLDAKPHRDDVILAQMPDGRALVMAAKLQDCDAACKAIGQSCDSSYDGAILNDCSFLNAAYGITPPAKCVIRLSNLGPHILPDVIALDPFAQSRHASQCTDVKNSAKLRNSRKVCPCHVAVV